MTDLWRKKPRTGKQSFMQHIEEIRIAVLKGENQKEIHSRLTEEGLSIGYGMFNRYVGRYILNNSAPAKKLEKNAPEKKTPDKTQREPDNSFAGFQKPEYKRFEHNPKPDEDLFTKG